MSDNSREITLAGNFKKSVDITDSLTNGDACSASNFSHAEGYRSQATGEYSYAGGYGATAGHPRSFVWSGISNNNPHDSKADGTFNIYVDVGTGGNGLNKIYVNGSSLSGLMRSELGGAFANSLLLEGSNNWSGRSNTFSSAVTVQTKLDVTGTFTANSTTTLNNTAYAKTTSFSSNGEEPGVDALSNIATVQHVRNALASSLAVALGPYVRGTSNNQNIGSTGRPVYINGGIVKEISSSVAMWTSKNLGGNYKPLFLSDGYLKQASLSCGNSQRFIYMNNGVLTATSVSIGGNNRPICIVGGLFKASSCKVGSSLRPVYFNDGVVTQLFTDARGQNMAMGNSRQPIYVNESGEFAVCQEYPGAGKVVASIGIEDGQQHPNKFMSAISAEYIQTSAAVIIKPSFVRPQISNIYGLLDEGQGDEKVYGSLSSVIRTCDSLNALCPKLVSSCATLMTGKAPKFTLSGNWKAGQYLSSIGYADNKISVTYAEPPASLTFDSIQESGPNITVTDLSFDEKENKLTKMYDSMTVVSNKDNTSYFVASLTWENATTLKMWRKAPPTSSGGVSFTIDSDSTSSQEVPASGSGNYGTKEFTLGFSGAIALTGVELTDHSADTRGLTIRGFWLDKSGTAHAILGNTSSSKASVGVKFYVLKIA